MRVRVLGSSGSEVPGHNPPAFLIDDFMLLDAGTVSISLDREAQCRISHIFLTHAHLDHIKAIPFLVDNLVSSNQHCRMTILSGRDVISDLRKNIFNNRIWPDFTVIPSPEHPVMSFREIKANEPVELRGYKIYATKVNHSVPAYGYIVQNASNESLVYTGDTGPTDRLWKRMSGHSVKALIIEVSFPDEMAELALASGHLTPSLLAGEIQKMSKIPEKIYITHLKPFYREAISEQISRQLPEKSGIDIEILEDGMIFSI